MKTLTFLVCVLVGLPAWADIPAVPFHKGVNLSGWFQADQTERIPFSRFGEQDFKNLKALGVDGARLPINLAGFTGPAPAYQIDPRLFAFLDQAVNWAEAQGLTLILDNHSDPLDPRIRQDLGRFLEAAWTQMASHYKDRSASVFFEIQNEPHEISDQDWARVQQRAISAIRKMDQVHTIVVGGADWNSEKALRALPVYTDKNLLYTFHFYDPFVFTHQGAVWAGLQDLSGVSFPPQGSTQPPFTPTAKTGWISAALKDYYSRDPVPGLARTLDDAAAFSKERKVPVWCGEFGVYNAKSDPAERATWYRTVRGLLEDRKIPWTMWDYKDSFGLFQKDSAEVFNQDLNLPLVDALGFQRVPQVPQGPEKVATGFFLYWDSWESGTREFTYSQKGTVEYASPDRPHQGLYCLRISGIARYDAVQWIFAPWKDLTALSERAGLSFWLRSSKPQFSFEVRFVDGQTSDAAGLPWRKSWSVDASQAPGDGQWHQVVIPLWKMHETGAWAGTWHEPQPGTFKWDRTARFEIVAEQADLTGVDLWFDEIQIR